MSSRIHASPTSESKSTNSLTTIALIAGGLISCLGLFLLIVGLFFYQWKPIASESRELAQSAVIDAEVVAADRPEEEKLDEDLSLDEKPLTEPMRSSPDRDAEENLAITVETVDVTDSVEDSRATDFSAEGSLTRSTTLVPAEGSLARSTTPVPVEPGIEKIHAYTMDQWALPEGERIVEAAIYRWDDQEDAFRFQNLLAFEANELRIEAHHGGLGQPIAVFRMSPNGVFRMLKSKWELDHHIDWLMIRTESEKVMLAIGREPSSYVGSSVTCSVFADSEPVGSDDPENPGVTDGLQEFPINTFRASKVVHGITRWSIVPPFSRSRIIVDDENVPWDSVDLAIDGLSCQWELTTQGNWMIASDVEPASDSMSSVSSSHAEVTYEKERVEIRTVFSVRLTSTLDDRQSGSLSSLYLDELTDRQRDTLSRTLRRSTSRRSKSPRRWRRPTSPMDLQDEDTAYLSVGWRHFRFPGLIDPKTPNMTDIASLAPMHPIDVSVSVPSVQFIDERSPMDPEKEVQLVFAEFQITCQ